jgi:hypothetical protein
MEKKVRSEGIEKKVIRQVMKKKVTEKTGHGEES